MTWKWNCDQKFGSLYAWGLDHLNVSTKKTLRAKTFTQRLLKVLPSQILEVYKLSFFDRQGKNIYSASPNPYY